MNNILKKALDEAYTSKWADELNESSDAGYAFSDEFVIKMHKTVNKTDHPFLYNARYIAAAAACAAVAVGCSMLVPMISSNKIPVQSGEVTTETTSDNTAADEPDATVSTVSDHDVTAVNTAGTIEISETKASLPEEITVVFSDDGELTKNTDNHTSVHGIVSSSVQEDVVITDTDFIDGLHPGRGTDIEYDEDSDKEIITDKESETADIEDDIEDDNVLIEDDYDSITDGDFDIEDDEGDDAVIVVDDSDDDSEDDSDDEYTGGNNHFVISSSGNTYPFPAAETFGEMLKYLYPKVDVGSLKSEEIIRTEIDNKICMISENDGFIEALNDFIVGLETAEYQEEKTVQGDKITLLVSDSVLLPDSDKATVNIVISVNIYRSGCICINEVVVYGKNAGHYRGQRYFSTDMEKTENLFKAISEKISS